MENALTSGRSLKSFFKEKFTLAGDYWKTIVQFLLAALFIVVGAWFIRHEQAELGEVKSVLLSSRWLLISLGIAVTAIYIFLQGFMYKMAFAAMGKRIPVSTTILLFLKRNVVSIFLPAGGIASLAFFSGDVDETGVSRTKTHFASSIYAFVGILTVILVAIPILMYALIEGKSGASEIFGVVAMILLITSLILVFHSVTKKKTIYRLLVRFFPKIEIYLEDLISHKIEQKYLIYTILTSVMIDFMGMIHMFISMKALGFQAPPLYAMLAYLITVLSLFISPFMRGLGAVEVSLTFILVKLGYANTQAIAITLLYRFFEFWLPLVTGALSFLYKINKLLMRILPALLIFTLGIINIISAVTPAVAERVHFLEDFIPWDAIAASNFSVMIAGVFMLLTSIFLFKGLKNAWRIALFLGIISFIGHLTKAIDYEEAIAAFFVIIVLWLSRKEYIIRSNPRLHTLGLRTALFSILVVLIYGTIGFYFLDKKHFGIDFNLWQSLGYTLRNFTLIGGSGLVPDSRFARDFLLSINISGFLSLSFFLYSLLKPYFFKESTSKEDISRARTLVDKFGRSGMDYFKTYHDKILFSPQNQEAFISYRTAGSFAVVLEDPVAENQEAMKQCIKLFDTFCYENSLKPIYYRVPEESLPVYLSLSKKSLFLGQEAIVDLQTFNLSGGKNKALRNAIHKVTDRGYKSTFHFPPVKDGLMQKLKAVSDEWLHSTQRQEIIFSQGMFVWDELKNQTILTVENAEEKVVAFLNIIPDYAPGEGTYDLIRKTDDAPNGVLDFLITELFSYLKSQGLLKVNLGFAPMSGMDDPHSFPEKSMKIAYERIKSFSHYKGLRTFKEKFFPEWYNKYLIYSNDYDLLQVPAMLAKVIKPSHD
jgi:phosphatidylglycerol lysyltransferase